MRKFILKLYCYIIVALLQACYSPDSILSNEMKIEQHYKSSLHLDKKFISYTQTIDKIMRV
jgi:hypothetical protein